MADTQTKPDPGHRTGLPRWMFAGLAIVVLGVLGVRFLYSKVSDNGASDASVEHSQKQQQQEKQPDRVTTTLADKGDAVAPTCPKADGSSPHTVQFTGPPPMCIDQTKTYVATVETTRGNFEITLDPSSAPANVNDFVFLAGWHFYDGVGFHRVIPGFVAQAGDPIGNPVGDPIDDDPPYDPQVGSGSPGYTVEDEFPTEQPFYPLLSVVVANRFPEPDTGSSQFFVVTGEEGQNLQPNYSRIGQVTSGDEVIDAIDKTGASDGSGDPLDLTVIESITIQEK